MNQYETLMLLDSKVSDADIAAIEKQMTTILKAGKGTLAKFDKWGRYRLAYPVRKQAYGVYALARYEVADIDTFFPKLETYLRLKCTDIVMRHTHVRLEDGTMSAEYVRPESIEEVGEPTDFRKDGRRGTPRGPRAGAPRDAAPVTEEVKAQAASSEDTSEQVAAEATADNDTTAEG